MSVKETFDKYRTGNDNPVLEILTGITPEEISRRSANDPIGRGSDKSTHAVTLANIAHTWNPMVARAAGLANELGGGALQAYAGGPFFGGASGFEVDDLKANELGIRASGAFDPAGSAVRGILDALRPKVNAGDGMESLLGALRKTYIGDRPAPFPGTIPK